MGRKVQLAQGLRQGCVLSPILYCAFINLLVMQRPEGAVAPTQLHGTFLDEFFSQGLQHLTRQDRGVLAASNLGEEGLHSAHMQGVLPCTLFMDDTTLLATGRNGLVSQISAYERFCLMFRMRINYSKSKVMVLPACQGLPA